MTDNERKARVRWILNHRIWGHPIIPRGWRGYIKDYEQDAYEHIRFDFVHVDPTTETIEDDDARNTAFRVWIEAGPPFDMRTDPHTPEPPGGWTLDNCWFSGHDLRLDCGDASMEGALLKLADLVEQHYNEDGTDKPEPPDATKKAE